jgi:hypothetical protein
MSLFHQFKKEENLVISVRIYCKKRLSSKMIHAKEWRLSLPVKLQGITKLLKD